MWKNLAATGFAGALLAMGITPLAAQEFIPYQAAQLPDGGILESFDISFVNPTLHTYALSASRVVDSRGPFGTVVIVDTNLNVVTRELIPDPPFAGACSFPARNTVTGPNGVFVIKSGANAEVWAGDGPVLTAAGIAHICSVTTGTPPNPVAGDIATPSSVKVFDLNTGATKAVINTGGNGRTDEGCYDPKSRVVLIANDETFDSFISVINADTYEVIQQIKFDGTDPNADNIIADGIEQCIFNPKDGNIYINLPNTFSATGAVLPGMILRISGTKPYHIEKIVADFSKEPWSGTGCVGGSGIALGPDKQLANSCGLIVNYETGAIIFNDETEGGADEIWFNDGDYFFADSMTTPPQLGVIAAGPPPSPEPVAVTAVGSHSVAADSVTGEVYVPIRGNDAVANSGAVCSKATDAFGNAGSDALGCILTYIGPR
jgi:hypothetical protein